MTVACSLLDLLEHPRALADVRAEQAAVLEGQPLDLGALCRMPALLRAINESMRLHGNGGLWRLTHKPVELGGYTIPAGSLVGTSMGLVNGDPTFYRDPARYDPDRYREMKTDDFQSPSLKERRFGAFGLGRHVCPGRGLAYVMVGTAVTVLLRDFSVEVRSRPLGWLNLMTAGLARPLGGFRVRVAPIERASKGG
jgi:cytochrome P450